MTRADGDDLESCRRGCSSRHDMFKCLISFGDDLGTCFNELVGDVPAPRLVADWNLMV